MSKNTIITTDCKVIFSIALTLNLERKTDSTKILLHFPIRMPYIRFCWKGQNQPVDILDCFKLTPTGHTTIKQNKLSITFIFCFVGQHGAMNCVTNSVDPVRKTVLTWVSSNDLQMNSPVFQPFPGLEITQYA